MSKKIIVGSLMVGCLFAFSTLACAGAPTVQNGKKVKMQYKISLGGKMVSESKKDAPVEFIYGKDTMMPGIEKMILGLKAGEHKTATVQPEDAFGPVNPQAVVEVPKTKLPPGEVKSGMMFNTTNASGKPMRAIVKEVRPETVVLDFNHPLAGKALEIEVDVLQVS